MAKISKSEPLKIIDAGDSVEGTNVYLMITARYW